MTDINRSAANDDAFARLIFSDIRPSRAGFHDDEAICFVQTSPARQRVFWSFRWSRLRLLAAQLPFRNHRALSHWANDNFGGDAA